MKGNYESPASHRPHFPEESLSRSAKTGVLLWKFYHFYYGSSTIERPPIRPKNGLMRTIGNQALETRATHEPPKQN
ncbi:hypothetical protein OAF65_09715 [Verrucomicrobiales bacterium]|nr:hypothetical protein [Verrucomicrobiales bacterium]